MDKLFDQKENPKKLFASSSKLILSIAIFALMVVVLSFVIAWFNYHSNQGFCHTVAWDAGMNQTFSCSFGKYYNLNELLYLLGSFVLTSLIFFAYHLLTKYTKFNGKK